MKIFDVTHKKQEREHSHSLPNKLQLAKKILFLPTIEKMEEFTLFRVNTLSFYRNIGRENFFATTISLLWFAFFHAYTLRLSFQIKTLDLPKNTISLTVRAVRLWCFKSLMVRLEKSNYKSLILILSIPFFQTMNRSEQDLKLCKGSVYCIYMQEKTLLFLIL
ncbi:hypothetical protein [Flectobacillus roseus]|uniref:hypothetical protein n=1 Tax=Flectobacillus roseus TaxID=502259 RepID=UPI0024B81A22|nr:hypothetical protein [Flectobacillus roseus]MDI9871155.1 hypothetical protein [Flectobacillus roseus]